MSITTILFDLDGTLLPMDQDTFAKAYISGLTVAAEPIGYSPMILSTAIMAGTAAMIKNTVKKQTKMYFGLFLKRRMVRQFKMTGIYLMSFTPPIFKR